MDNTNCLSVTEPLKVCTEWTPRALGHIFKCLILWAQQSKTKRYSVSIVANYFSDQSQWNISSSSSLQVLVRRCADGAELRGRIVETEAYLGGEDRASHSAGGKRTERNTAMFMKPGTIYVYPIYGIYLCMNVSSEGKSKKVEIPASCCVHYDSHMCLLIYANIKNVLKPFLGPSIYH